MKADKRVNSISVLGWPPGSASRVLQEVRYYFWLKNWNLDPKKPICRYVWRLISVWPLDLYLAGLQDRPPASSRRTDIIFDSKIKSLTLKNIDLDIHVVANLNYVVKLSGLLRSGHCKKTKRDESSCGSSHEASLDQPLAWWDFHALKILLAGWKCFCSAPCVSFRMCRSGA